MVLIEFKRADKSTFLAEASANTQISELLVKLSTINNLRVRILHICKAIEGLAENGPLRHESLRGLTQEETYRAAFEMLSAADKQQASISPLPHQEMNQDSTGFRTGLGLSAEYKQKLKTATDQALASVSPEKVNRKECLTVSDLEEELKLLRGAIMIAFPGYYGIPNWEPVYLLLEDKFDFPNSVPDSEWLESEKTVLWWAKKELVCSKLLKDYCGANEKTKIVIKPMTRGKGAPLSEPPVDSETQKKMMSYYYKKQEEAKKLEEENDDNYLNSAWADPKNLKRQLVNGGRGIQLGSFK